MATISTELKVTGISRYTQAMKQGQNAVKNLDAELKLNEAQYKASGNAEEYCAKKAELLQKQIAEQQKVVEEGERALEAMAKNGVDKASTSYTNMQRQVTTARTALIGMQSAFKNVQNGASESAGALDETTSSAKKTGDALDGINKVSFSGVTKGIAGVAAAAGAAVVAVGAVMKGLWDAEVDASVWADNVLTAATQAGMDTTEYQQYEYASKFIDTEVDAILNARAKLVRAPDTSGDTLKIFEDDGSFLGISTRNADGSLKDTMELFWDAIDAIGSMEDPTLQEKAAMELFGESYRELGTLFKEGAREDWFAAMAESENAVVSEEKVQQLGAANDAWEDLNATWTATKNSVLAELAPAFTTIADSMTQMLTRFKDWSESKSGQKALNDFGNAVAALFGSVTDQTFEDALDKVTGLIGGISDAFNWISENSDTVVSALKAIGIALAGIKVAEGLTTVLKLMQQLGGASGIANAVTAASGGSAGTGGGGTALGNAAGLAVLGSALYAGKETIQQGIATFGKSSKDKFTQTAEALKDNGFLSFVSTVTTGDKEKIAEEIIDVGSGAAVGLMEANAQRVKEAGLIPDTKVTDTQVKGINKITYTYDPKTGQLVESITVSEEAEQAVSAANAQANAANNTRGTNVGYAPGLGAGHVIPAATEQEAEAAIATTAWTAQDSMKMYGISFADMLDDSFTDGVDETLDGVNEAVSEAMYAVGQQIVTVGAGALAHGAGGKTLNYNSNVYIDTLNDIDGSGDVAGMVSMQFARITEGLGW